MKQIAQDSTNGADVGLAIKTPIRISSRIQANLIEYFYSFPQPHY
jgi:hypothetical protein